MRVDASMYSAEEERLVMEMDKDVIIANKGKSMLLK
ncbi:hypothetical protein A2U01_0111314, partial [Trifolium medium]|nr:hypothetical protein [Trifolium medium]